MTILVIIIVISFMIIVIMVMVIITHQNPHDMKINLRQAAVTNVTPAAMMKKSG